MEPIIYIFVAVGGIVLGFGLARVFAGSGTSKYEQAAEAETARVLDAARAEAEEIKKAAQIEGKELAFKRKADVEADVRQRRDDIAAQKDKLTQRERQLNKRTKDFEKNRRDLDRRLSALDGREKQAESLAKKAAQNHAEAQRRLESVAGMSQEQARIRLEEEIAAEVRATVAEEVKDIEDAARQEANSKSQTILATAIQRYASEFVQERTVTTVSLPSDDLKGRLIGREGRNVRALEAATGTDIIIDDTPELITVSCFHPVRREIARIALSTLVADGRIHPTRIEEVVQKAEKEVSRQCQYIGEQAVFDLGLHRIHPELVKALGTLKFRMSYAQNVLTHSVEVGYIAGLMAAECGVSVKLARRAGLLHDIGKAADHEQDGAHAIVGAAMASKYCESAKICQAISSHHDDVAPTSILDHLVHAANALSNARPGARREQLATYVQRLEAIETLCSSYPNVTNAFAVLAGREVRVIVENDKVNDAEAMVLSKDIAKRIESEAIYPGQIRVVVLRETRASDYA